MRVNRNAFLRLIFQTNLGHKVRFYRLNRSFRATLPDLRGHHVGFSTGLASSSPFYGLKETVLLCAMLNVSKKNNCRLVLLEAKTGTLENFREVYKKFM